MFSHEKHFRTKSAPNYVSHENTFSHEKHIFARKSFSHEKCTEFVFARKHIFARKTHFRTKIIFARKVRRIIYLLIYARHFGFARKVRRINFPFPRTARKHVSRARFARTHPFRNRFACNVNLRYAHNSFTLYNNFYFIILYYILLFILINVYIYYI